MKSVSPGNIKGQFCFDVLCSQTSDQELKVSSLEYMAGFKVTSDCACYKLNV